MLTMERYFAIVHPLKYQAAFAKQPRLKVGVVIAACWIFTIIAKSYNITLFEVEDGACVSSAESRSKVLGVLTAMVHYVVPVTVMLFAYIRISVELKRRAARLQPALPPVDPTAGVSTADTARPINVLAASLLRARRNVFKMLLIVFVTFLICWTPNQVLFLMFNLGLPLRFDEWYILLSVAMVSANCCVNPLIYAFKYQQFRRGLREMFCHRRVGLHPDSSNPTNFIQAVR
ncbi:trissin receptor-like [Acanthaster planci]|uniref:Trissin receptor-like n=1 Tax=Acanthaster planci TaxID=133434 RepID=A0A8B7YVI6_ACAPL|nr:trissin receptor-like [Acanthaster planci]